MILNAALKTGGSIEKSPNSTKEFNIKNKIND